MYPFPPREPWLSTTSQYSVPQQQHPTVPEDAPPSVHLPSQRGCMEWSGRRARGVQGKANLRRFLWNQKRRRNLQFLEGAGQGRRCGGKGPRAAGASEIRIIPHTHQWSAATSAPQRPLSVWRSLRVSFQNSVFKHIKIKYTDVHTDTPLYPVTTGLGPGSLRGGPQRSSAIPSTPFRDADYQPVTLHHLARVLSARFPF